MTSEKASSILAELVARVVKVRRRLVAWVLLRSLARVFFALAVYLTLFALLDHRLHFGVVGRCIALAAFIAIGVILLVLFLRQIRVSVGLKHAASHVESARPYHQQLLAAIEYHQQPVNYPYSQSLAHAMLGQLWGQAKDDDFSATVSARKLWFCAAVLVLGLAVTGLFVRHHYAFLSRYASRLGRPTAALGPLPATRLKSLDGDMAVEPNEIVTLQVAIEGRLPRTGTLVIEARADSEDYDSFKALTLKPIADDTQDDPMFQGVYSFAEKGFYRYQFQAAGQETPWHAIRVCTFPEIERITARVSFDAGAQRLSIDETVTDFVLSVLAGSEAEITVYAGSLLDRAQIEDLDGHTQSYEINDSNQFTFTTSLDHEGQIAFRLHDTQDLWSRDLPPLTIKIKEDELPQFSLEHPAGDGFATNVASIPIRFEITDDFGIAEAALSIELGNGRTERIPIDVNDRGRTVKIDHVLELEQYELDVGDAVLFYAGATDVATGPVARSRPITSDVFFLEIKPYRKKWIQCGDGPPCPPGQGPIDPSLIHDKLVEILEYARAFLKKTWRLANQEAPDDGDTVKLAAIAHDVQYAGEQLTLIRDDPRYGFDASEIETIDGVLDHLESARTELLAGKAQNAIGPEMLAYRALRRLVDDKIRGDLKAGAPMVKNQPDKIELNEVQHLTRLERAQVAWQLDAMSQQLAEVAREQETLGRTFMHFLDAAPGANQPFEVNDEKSWFTDGSPSQQTRQSPSGANARASAQDRTVEGALKPPSSPTHAAMAMQLADVMKVLRAHQRQLRAELSQLHDQLARLSIGQDTEDGRPSPIESRKAARDHLDQAQTEMNRFETLLAQQYYSQADPNQLFREAPPLLGAIRSELTMARQALQREAGSYIDDETERLKQMALDLESLANAYDRAVTPEQRRQLLNELTAVAGQFNAAAGGPAIIPGAGRPGASEPVIAIEGYGDRDIVNAARFAARRFLSKDMDVTQQSDEHAPATSSGSLKFYDQEIDFFESAAKDPSQR